MAFRPSDVIGVVWHHPILSVVVLLLFTPPLFPIVVYFSPLLISTALFILAMISMGSDHNHAPSSYGDDMPYKRVWIEEVDVDGPSLDGQRVPKRLKAASSGDEGWFDKMKNWEGTGRAWVESVLSQEARKSFSSDENATSRDESVPLLDKARGFFSDDVVIPSQEPDYVPKTSSKPIEVAETLVSANDSAPPVSGEKPENAAHLPRAVDVDSAMSNSEITPELESEDELIEIAPANIPPSPLFRSKSLGKAEATVNVPADVSKTQDAPSEVQPNSVKSVGSVPGTDSEDGKKTISGSDSTNEDGLAPVVEQKSVEHAPADVDNGSNSVRIPSQSDTSVAKESNLLSRKTAQGSAGEIKPEIKAVSSGVSSSEGADGNLAEIAQANAAMEGDDGKSGVQPPSETKSAAELLAPLRQDQQTSHRLGTPSAAVALSEKLKVPLADIMSLLAGEDKETVPNEAPSGVKVVSSSETTTSQEEDWSGSDVESPVPLTTGADPTSAEKDT